MIVTDTKDRLPDEPEAQLQPSAEEQTTPESEQSPPPYSPPAPGSSIQVPPPQNTPPDLAPTNYAHVREKNSALKQQYIIDMGLPPPPASALPSGTDVSVLANLLMESHNGSVGGEAWVLYAKREHHAHSESRTPSNRARLRFLSHNGSTKATVHAHPSTVAPRPFLSIDARSHNGSVMITIPRSFRGQLTLHTDNGRVHLSPALAPRAAQLSSANGTHTYFVGERPSCGQWRTSAHGDGDEVDEASGWTKNGGVAVSYDDESTDTRKMPGMLSTLMKAIGLQ
ncbi:hypothetical protein BC834DRAFT_247513 [Gloeopeniophorella convolvens]|nr:hypothetical protein BC834DRAFT_247513 [Gloeopeniophorella convolvens]